MSNQNWQEPPPDVPAPDVLQDAVPQQRTSSAGHLHAAWLTVGGKIMISFLALVALVAGVAIGHFILPAKTTTAATAALAPVQSQTTAPPTAPDSAPAVTDVTSSPSADAAADGASGAAVPGPNATGVGTVDLVNLTPATGAFSSGDKDPTVNGQVQLLPLVQDVGCGNAVSGDIGYDLGRDYTNLSMLLGIDDESTVAGVSPTLEVDGDGVKLQLYTPTLGHPVNVSLNVTGVLRLDFHWSYQTTLSCYYNSPAAGTIVFGNPQLTTVAGYRPSPPATPTD
jgi:hypothetical protein